MMTPLTQKPHCIACSSMKAFWMGCGFSLVPNASSVVISDPLGALITSAKLATLKKGQSAVAWTEKTPATMEAAMGEPFSLIAERLVLG